jgi:hypothetical protein
MYVISFLKILVTQFTSYLCDLPISVKQPFSYSVVDIKPLAAFGFLFHKIQATFLISTA